MNGYFKQVKAALQEHGFFYLKPGKGSHQWWSNGTIKVQVPVNCYSRHTANAIMQQAGIPQRF